MREDAGDGGQELHGRKAQDLTAVGAAGGESRDVVTRDIIERVYGWPVRVFAPGTRRRGERSPDRIAHRLRCRRSDRPAMALKHAHGTYMRTPRLPARRRSFRIVVT
jgi:hypothetical protein